MMKKKSTRRKWTLAQAWIKTAETEGILTELETLEAQIAEVKKQYPVRPDWEARFGPDWRNNIQQYIDKSERALQPLRDARSRLEHKITEALHRRMLKGEWQASGRPGSVAAAPVDLEPASWDYFDLAAVRHNRLRQRTGRGFNNKIDIYLVKVWPSDVTGRRPGRPNEKEWVRSWAKQKYPNHADLPKKLTGILPELNRAVDLEIRERKIIGQSWVDLKDRMALKYLKEFRDDGYGTHDG